MQTLKLSKRLTAAADLVREGAFVADVGTDHAYLPLWLLLEGRIRGGVVSDINEGPLSRAVSHIRQYGAEDRLSTLLCDGLAALEPYAPEDVFILGMGGELIARILSDAPFVKKAGIRLILQPMTHPELLRAYLLSAGFRITEEVLVKEEKIYQILAAEYTGEVGACDKLSLLFGEINLRRGGSLLLELLHRWEDILLRRLAGKQGAGEQAEEEERLLSDIRKYLKKKEINA